MRKSRFILPTILAATLAVLASSCPPVSAQGRDNCSVPSGYYRDNIGGCLHRYPWALLQGFPNRWNECNRECVDRNGAPAQSDKPPVFTLATPQEVIAALECDFKAASKDSRVKDILLRTAIKGTLTFTLVAKTSAGVSLTIPAVPVFVFPSASITPSLEASRLTDTTQSDKVHININPAATSRCVHDSDNKWLTSKVMRAEYGQITVDKNETEVTFVLQTKGAVGLKLNIVPVAIGPQVSRSYENTQKLSLTFDYSKAAEAPAGKSAEQPGVSQTPGTECVVDNPSGRPMNVRETPRGATKGVVGNGKRVRALRFAAADNGQPWAYVSDIDLGREIGWVFFPYLTCTSAR